MATNTYVALATTTLSSSASSIDFTSISGAYTDLVIIGNMYATSNDVGAYIQFNGDTGTNYSSTFMFGNGSTAGSARYSNQTSMNVAGYNYGIGSTNSIYSPIQVNIQNYSNTTTNKTVLARSWVQNNAASRELYAYTGLWRSTAAITSIKFILNTGSWAAGSTFTLYGIAAESNVTPKATGGIVYQDATYYYHAFYNSGTFTPSASLTADALVIAGGGAGGGDTNNGGGGGGAGGLVWRAGTTYSATPYTVTIGAGGTGASANTGGSGGNTTFDTITALGGGGGGAGPNISAGASGGSGGGGGGGNLAGGSATQSNSGGGTGYGNAGGRSNSGPCGGGGGAGAAGTDGINATQQGGNGGNGLSGATISALNLIGAATYTGQLSGGNYYYAGGGAGSYSIAGDAGLGGGGVAVVSGVGGNGAVATGGGGAGTSASGSAAGGNGGSGLVVIRYAK